MGIHGEVLIQFLGPVDIRVDLRKFGALGFLETLDDAVGGVGVPGDLVQDTFALDDVVLGHHRFVGVHLGRLLGDRLARDGVVEVEAGLAFFTTLGGDEDDAVCTFHTEDGRRGCVLQDGDALDFVDVDVVHVTLDTIDEDQGAAAVPGVLTTDEEARRTLTGRDTAGLTGGSQGNQTRGLADERFRKVRRVADLAEGLVAHLGNRGHDTLFLLGTVTDDHRFLDRFRTRTEGYRYGP